MMSTFENEAIHYCFLNVWLTLGLTKKNHKKKKSVVTERFGYVKRNGESYLVIQSWKHSYVGLAYRLVVGINIA